MKQFLITIAGVLVGLILFLIVVPIALIGMAASGADRPAVVPANTVLSVDLREERTDQPPRSAFAFGEPSTIDLIQRLEAGAADKRVKGVFVRANVWGMAPAEAEEIRAALAKVRSAGKFVIAHMQPDGVTTSMAGYAAIAGGEVWTHPNEHFMPMGIAVEGTFLRGFFDKFKMKPEFEQREAFKGAADPFMQRGYTKESRGEIEKLVADWGRALSAMIAEDRKLPVDQVRTLIEGSPYPSERAKELKLVDQLGFPEDAARAALERAGPDAELVEIGDYAPPVQRTGPVIAVIGGEGTIVSGVPETGLFGDTDGMNSDVIAKAIDEAAEDENVKAIVFRVNSPGGTLTASDQILAAVKRAKADGKKVVVSMGPQATSGGYWVSAAADEIVASATTLTGSIGVVGGKVAVGDALEHYLGITTDTGARTGSPLSEWSTASRPFTNAEKQFFADYIDSGYATFLATVAEGRGLDEARLAEVAGGRLWTGAQAQDGARGLVDQIGGFSVAVDRAKTLAGLKPDAAVQVKFYPTPRSPIEELSEVFGVSSEAAAGAAALGAILGDERVEAALRRLVAEERAGRRVEGPQMIEVR